VPHKDLNNIPHFDGIIVMLLGLWGAIMNFLKRKQSEYSLLRKVSLFVVDVLTSGGIAIVTYLVVFGYTENAYLSVGISGVLAHQGTRAFYILEQIIEKKAGVKL